MRHIWNIAIKDLRLLSRDWGGLFFAVGFPFLMAIFFGTIFSTGGGSGGGGSSRISIAVVDEDGSERSQAFVSTLREADELRVTTEAPGAEGVLTPLTRDQAEEMVRMGGQTAYLAIPQGYGSEDISMFWGERPALEIGVDPSRQAAAAMVEGIVTKYAFEEFGDVFQNPAAMREEVARNMRLIAEDESLDPVRRTLIRGMFAGIDGFMADAQERAAATGDSDGGAGLNPVTITMREVAAPVARKRNAYAWTFPQGVMWGVAGCAAAFGISLVTERSRGTLTRLRASPLSWTQVLAGKGLACFLAIMAVGTMLLVVARFGFGVVPTSVGLLALGLTMTALCFVGIMMLLSVLGRTEASASGIGWAIILVMMMTGGAAVPLEVMPGWMQNAAGLSPVRWGIRAIEGGLWRGYDAQEMALPCAILIGVGALSAVVGVTAFRWLETRS